jgi:hypothetical protein
MEKLEESQKELMDEVIEDCKKHSVDPEHMKEELAKIKEKINKFEQPFVFEPVKTNMFIVKFPDYFNIKPYTIQSIKMPKWANNKWGDTEISIREFISDGMNDTLLSMRARKNFGLLSMKGKKNFEIEVLLLDPTGETVGKWYIFVKKIKSLDFGSFSYTSEMEIAKTTIILGTKKCFFTF